MNSEAKKIQNHDFEEIKVRGVAPESELIRDPNGEIIYEKVKELSEILPPMEPPRVDNKIDMEVSKLSKERQSPPKKVIVPATKKIRDDGISFEQKIVQEERKLYAQYRKEVEKPDWKWLVPDSESVINLPSGKKGNVREPIEKTKEKIVVGKIKRNL